MDPGTRCRHGMKQCGNPRPSFIGRGCDDCYGAAGNPCLHLWMHDDRASHGLFERRCIASIVEKADLVLMLAVILANASNRAGGRRSTLHCNLHSPNKRNCPMCIARAVVFRRRVIHPRRVEGWGNSSCRFRTALLPFAQLSTRDFLPSGAISYCEGHIL